MNPEVVAGGGHIDIGARFVGLGFQREAVAVALRDVVLAKIVDAFAQMLDGIIRAAAGVGFHAFAAAPQYKNLGAEFRAQVHCAQRFLQSVGAHLRIVCRERPIAEHRMKEQIHRGHGHDNSVFLAGLFELADNAVALGRSRVDGYQVVVVQVHAPGANFAQHLDDLVGRQGGAHGFAERVTAAVP